MDKKLLCEKLKNTTYLVNVLQDGKLIDQGTAVCINELGDLITAAHVLSGSLPVREKHLQDLEILAKSETGKLARYVHIVCGFSISFPEFKDPITVDLAILKKLERSTRHDYLEVLREKPVPGEDVVMAGYSNEVFLPFAFETNIHYRNSGLAELQEKFDEALQSNMRFSMYKSGMVGRCYGVKFSDPKLGLITGHTFYIDNVMHKGASGGPVINSSGNLVGIVMQRAVTDLEKKEIPSGSSIAISPHTILDFLDAQPNANEVKVPWHLAK